ncbi:MAG TPA: hypothetical protein VJB82_04875 [Candidatus Peribacterales bacterium]|nr:hypothetical protein [Candidatus Peribacterales bacterium]
MSNTKTPEWYDVETVVEMLIHETPRGQKYAPHFGNLCIGFTHLTIDKLEEELKDIRTCWPFIFPATMGTQEVLRLIQKKYPVYSELMELKDRE